MRRRRRATRPPAAVTRSPTLMLSPLMHGAGLFAGLIVLLHGGTLATVEGTSFDADRAIDAVRDTGAVAMTFVGDAFALPLADALERRADSAEALTKLRVVVSSGAVFSASVKRRMLAVQPRLMIVDALGSSESAGDGCVRHDGAKRERGWRLQGRARTRDAAGRTFPSLRELLYGASPIPLDVLIRTMVRFPNAQLVQMYGSTETSGTVVYLPPEDHDPAGTPRMAGCGKPFPEVALRVVDEDGCDLPIGDVGELMVRAPLLVAGYHARAEATAAAFDGGWYRTGDASRLDRRWLSLPPRSRARYYRAGVPPRVDGGFHRARLGRRVPGHPTSAAPLRSGRTTGVPRRRATRLRERARDARPPVQRQKPGQADPQTLKT